MKSSKLDTKKDFIAGALASGVSQGEIAEQVGVHQSTVSRFSNKTEIREAIEQQTLSILECLPDAVENIKSLVRDMKNLSPKETKRIELALKASFRVLESCGLLSSTTPSQTVATLTRIDTCYISPIVDQVLAMTVSGINYHDSENDID